jgi:hypothetical protein
MINFKIMINVLEGRSISSLFEEVENKILKIIAICMKTVIHDK